MSAAAAVRPLAVNPLNATPRIQTPDRYNAATAGANSGPTRLIGWETALDAKREAGAVELRRATNPGAAPVVSAR